MKTLIPLGLLLALFSSLGFANTMKKEEIKIISYNVEFGAKSTPEQMGEYLKAHNADIITFSEVPNRGWTERVGDIVGMKYAYVGEISSAHHRNKYKSILSRTPLSNSSEILLDAPGRWNPASAVRSETKINGNSVAIYSLHVAQSSGEGHTTQLINESLKNDPADFVLVAGDFNNNLGSHELNYVETAGYKATWQDLDIDFRTATSVVSREIENRHGIIDHIFYRNNGKMKAIDGGIMYTSIHTALSDHHAIWATLTVTE
ncbi:endonuclease/exonuclease/phosphatase family protein [Photobacterium sp. ZSDE20]|uniref:Endonuclease/exonuclease/phosphatase family protein n=1 Tax=Photobacterium pectinilyticum TaxID=2906793 RepID=A0ABT1MVX7_9GAMM|nr:endonuclease/exonuclease/phosphatase family protein [Photobacterium sp. ZSDE20]MCQ1056638.1 endonuclease/exonuclease/phosphatase family protein [Photobacterium sp. ZSDE20]MDD1820773.1 endonuclease/exonuclease/phosphatase family protein [Photobacterium sp. ZSDE20]